MGSILVVDDEADIRELIADILRDEGHEIRVAWNSDSALAEIDSQPPDMIILDIWLKDSKLDGIGILTRTRHDNPDIPVVIISGHGNIEIAVAAVRQGAYDFVEKPFNIDQLLVVVGRALETSRLRRENAALRRAEAHTAVMLGESVAFRTLRARLDKLTRGNGRVMLSGPPGAGKEVAARYLHCNSDRANAPFVSVVSASIEPDRMEEVLFGREDGGEITPGLFERAHGGILYFDEVADMPAGTQSKILRVLVDQSFTRLGGQSTVRVDVRVISSTTRDLQKDIAEGRFREELFHRLNVVPIQVPALEQRRNDIPVLCSHFLAELSREQGLPLREASPEAITRLQSLSWPGNIRQLRNILERALIMGPDNGPIGPEELPDTAPRDKGPDSVELVAVAMTTQPLREAREVFEREYLITQVNRFTGNISRASAFVGMERSALHRKLKLLGISIGQSGAGRQAEPSDSQD